MRAIALACLALATWGGGPPMNAVQDSEKARLAALAPLEIRGWKTVGDDVYDRETIFDYIDGAGEVYRAFNMRLLLSRRFERAGEPDIIADLFDMGSPPDAFGVFAHDLEGEDWKLGQGSLYKGGLLQLWRGRYFAALFAERETPEAREALAELGRAVAGAAGPDGPLPDLVDRIPERFRSGTIRYFHEPVILNYHFFVSGENILRLGPGVEGVLATVGARADRKAFLLVRYPTEAEAGAAAAGFIRGYRPESKAAGTEERRAAGIIPDENGRFAAAGRAGRLVLVLFGLPSLDEARASLASEIGALGR